MKRPTLLTSLLVVLALPASVKAHEFAITKVAAILNLNGGYQIDVVVDVDALALGIAPSTPADQVVRQMRALSDAEFAECVERVKKTISKRIFVRFDGRRVLPEVEFPQFETLHGDPDDDSVLGIIVRLTGKIPEAAVEFNFTASRSFKVVNLTIMDRSTAAITKYTLAVAEGSPLYRLGETPVPQSRASVARRYAVLGFEHILPKGLDHILFVVGLFLLSIKFRPLCFQITAFTVAHSLTLALSIYGVVSLPSRWVEPLIALSIAYVAIENLCTTELKPWRPAVVFGFGLLHGLGFAGVLNELGLPRSDFATALVAFNVGVEAGQITVVALALLLVGWFRHRSWYRKAIVVPGSVLIAATGLYWFVTRVMGSW